MTPGVNLTLDPAVLEPLIAAVVQTTLARLEAQSAQLNGKLAYTEAEDAALLSLHPHQLRDERRRGRIGASVGPGKKVLYTCEDLIKYLLNRRWQP
jgi:hypothetical protein